MTRFVECRDVAQPPEVVADLVFDWALDPSWRPAVVAMDTEPAGRATAGQRIVERLRFAGSTYVTPTRIVAVSNTEVEFTGGSGGVVVSGRRVVVPHGAGSRVIADIDIAMTGVRRALMPLLTPAYRRRHRADLDRLVALLDRPAPDRSVLDRSAPDRPVLACIPEGAGERSRLAALLGRQPASSS